MQRLHCTALKLCLTLHWLSVLLAVLCFSCRNKVKILSAGVYLIQLSIAWNLWTKKIERFPPLSQRSQDVQLGASKHKWENNRQVQMWALRRRTVIRQVIEQRPKWRKCSDFKYRINCQKILLKSFYLTCIHDGIRVGKPGCALAI